MTTRLNRSVIRQTEFRDYRTGRPYLVILDGDGIRLHLCPKGCRRRGRSCYTVTYQQILLLAAKVRAEDMRREKEQRRQARRGIFPGGRP
jgi:pyruvate-formate lyase-activating enzyme